MSTCVLALYLMLFPIDSLYSDEVKQQSMIVQGCNQLNEIVKVWIKNHRLIIETHREYVQVPLPPIREPQEIWFSIDLQSDFANMGNWGNVMYVRGPKEPL